MRLDANWARAAAVSAWAVFFAWLWASDESLRYLGPRTVWVVPFGAIVLSIAAVGAVYAARREPVRMPLGARELGGLMVLLVPMLATVTVPSPELGASAAKLKAPPTAPAAGVPSPARRKSCGAESKVSFLELHYANLDPKHAPDYCVTRGRRVELTGFVTKAAGDSASLELTRFYISCCAADAVPYTAPIETGGAAGVFAKDTWLRVRGVVQSTGGRPVLVADSIDRVETPKDRYLYDRG